MGIRGEIFSSRVMCEGRTYFFNVKENRNGDVYLAIVESKPTESETFDRRSIVLFKENMQEFLQSFEKALSAMEKAGPSRGKTRKPADSAEASAPRKPRIVRKAASERTDREGSSSARTGSGTTRTGTVRKNPVAGRTTGNGRSRSAEDTAAKPRRMTVRKKPAEPKE